jgi:hypothetical protein
MERLSLVAFICTALFCMGKQVLDYGKTINAAQSVCSQIYQDESGKCAEAGAGTPVGMRRITVSENVSKLTLHSWMCDWKNVGCRRRYLSRSVILSYSRFEPFGWIAAGFGRTAQDRISA